MPQRILPSKTLSVSIAAEPARVYAFLVNGENLPKWATAFCKSAAPEGKAWKVQTPVGPVMIEFVPVNPFGVLDHDVTLPTGQTLRMPMRVIPNGAGSEVLFTLFRTPEMTNDQYAEDERMIQQDLLTLRRVMEGAV